MSIISGIKGVKRQLKQKAKGGPAIVTQADAIKGASEYNAAMRGGNGARLSVNASNFISENPNATKPGAPRLTEKYR